MNRHLSPEEVSNWVLGERNSQVMRHASTCPECASELEHFSTALSVFGKSAREWADKQCDVKANSSFGTQGSRVRLLMGAISCAAIAIAVCVFTGSFSHTRRKEMAVVDIAETDTELLQEVDVEVSQTVPSSMEPLTELMSWDQAPTVSRPHNKNRHARITKRKSAA